MNLAAVPRHKPEELNELSMAKRLFSLEKKFELLESSVSQNNIDITVLKENDDKNKNEISSHLKLINIVAEKIEKSPGPGEDVAEKIDADNTEASDAVQIDIPTPDASTDNNITVSERTNSVATPVADNSRPVTTQSKRPTQLLTSVTSDKTYNRPQTYSRPSYLGQPREGSNRHQVNQTRAEVIGEGPSGFGQWPRLEHRQQSNSFSRMPTHDRARVDNEGFITPRDQHQRAIRLQKKSNQNQFFIYNVFNRYTIDNVFDHLVDYGVSVTDLYQRSHPNAKKKSFVLTTVSQASTILSPNIWPVGIRVREYKEYSEY